MRIQPILVGITVLSLSILAMPAGAQVNIQVGIPLPPPLIFSAPPQLVVLPETYVYVVPDIPETSFSSTVGGGVRGRGTGTVRSTMTGIGVITQVSRRFIERCPKSGDMSIGTINGEGSPGTTSA